MEDLEKEYTERREETRTQTAEDDWKRGNVNRLDRATVGRRTAGAEEEESQEEDGDDDEDEQPRGNSKNRDLPPLESSSEDEEELAFQMAEIRKKVLASKAFAEPSPNAPPKPAPSHPEHHSGSEDDHDDDYDDGIPNAHAVPDDAGPSILYGSGGGRAGEGGNEVTAVFSRMILTAPNS